MSKILLVHRKEAILQQLSSILSETSSDVRQLANTGKLSLTVEEWDPDVVMLDIDHPDADWISVLDQMKTEYSQLPTLVITEKDDTELTINSMQHGAFEFIHWPSDKDDFLTIVREAMECRQQMKRAIQIDDQQQNLLDNDTLIGSSPQMQEVYKAIGRVAATNATVLITGETGTGKELVARAIYQHSLRSKKRFVTLNCAAIPENLLESKLFGHEKGAFTGAVNKRIGKFEQGSEGTIFLDEIGELPTPVQAKLLRVLEEQQIERVGGNVTVGVDTRVIAATNRELENEIAEGRFREDLYHRLNVMEIHLPPLRERQGDIEKLINYFYVYYTETQNLTPAPITPEAMQEMRDYSWPGNVRELQHCINRVLILSGGYPITSTDVRMVLFANRSISSGQADTTDASQTLGEATLQTLVSQYLDSDDHEKPLKNFLGEMESAMIARALRTTNGNQSQAAKLLGISRPSVKAKMDKYGITCDVAVND